MRELQRAKTIEVVVGVQQGSDNAEGESIAEYAAYNEFGTDKIPERSFMRTAFDENVNSLSAALDRSYAQIQAGNMTVYRALGLVGLLHQDQIQHKIDTNVPPPNSPITIAWKGSSHTLIDTGAMKNSIRYIIRPVR